MLNATLKIHGIFIEFITFNELFSKHNISHDFIFSFNYGISCQGKQFVTEWRSCLKVAVNVSSSGKPVLRYMYYVNEPGLTLLMKKNP